MNYKCPDLLQQCHQYGWLSTNPESKKYVSPDSWHTVLVYSTHDHVVQLTVDQYVQKALRLFHLKYANGTTLSLLKNNLDLYGVRITEFSSLQHKERKLPEQKLAALGQAILP